MDVNTQYGKFQTYVMYKVCDFHLPLYLSRSPTSNSSLG